MDKVMGIIGLLLIISGSVWVYNIVKSGIIEASLFIPPTCLIVAGAFFATRKEKG